MLQKAAVDGSNTWGPATHGGDTDSVPGSWLLRGVAQLWLLWALGATSEWKISFFFFSVGLSAFQLINN